MFDKPPSLQGQQQEHRNMPLDDAMAFVSKSYVKTVDPKKQEESGLTSASGEVVPNYVMRILGFLMDSRPLSVVEYDKLLKFLAKVSPKFEA